MWRQLRVIIIILLLVTYHDMSKAHVWSISPSIEGVFSGPIKWHNEFGERYRLLVISSEVTNEVFLQRILIGDEGCCLEISTTYELNSEILNKDKAFFDVSNVVWIDFDKFSLIVNSKKYTFDIRLVDGEHIAVKKSNRDTYQPF